MILVKIFCVDTSPKLIPERPCAARTIALAGDR